MSLPARVVMNEAARGGQCHLFVQNIHKVLIKTDSRLLICSLQISLDGKLQRVTSCSAAVLQCAACHCLEIFRGEGGEMGSVDGDNQPSISVSLYVNRALHCLVSTLSHSFPAENVRVYKPSGHFVLDWVLERKRTNYFIAETVTVFAAT